jgi:putative NADH-flavin reductase
MHVAIFGASRGVGRAAVDAAVLAGHTVTAFSRTAWSATSDAVTVIAGDVLDRAAVSSALAGANAVLVSLGVTPGQRATTPEDICSRGTRTIVDAMKTLSIARLLIVTSYGVGETRSRTPFLFSIFAKTILRGIMADKEVQEREVRASGLQWTIVQPLGLTDEPATGHPYVAADGSRATNRVSRADVGAVCIDALAGAKFIGACVAVSGAK